MAPAQVPDLTNGGAPGDSESFNVGPTGFRAWAYHEDTSTSKSRQLLVKTVDAGSPADSLLSVNDVILGADGSGASQDPSPFSWDARRSIADAINAAEARSPATLKLLRWRAGVTDTVTLTLETMGAYSATAPYNCPKSRNILAKCIPIASRSGNDGFNGLQILVLLAANDPSNPDNAAHQAQARTWAHQWICNAAEINELKLGRVVGEKKAWNYSYRLIVLAEYYLHTRDPAIFPTLEALAICFARNQSCYGTTSHEFASKNADGSDNGPITAYGAINATSVAGFLGLAIAREAGVTNALVDEGISRSERFFASYTGKGTIPYGENPPGLSMYDMNGKCATAALAFSRLPNRTEEAQFFAKMTTLSHGEREKGHAGPYFAYVWSPLGAAVNGEESAAYYFSNCRWLYDLARCWNGDIEFDHYGIASGQAYGNFSDAMTVLTTYALPLRQLHITGRNHPESLRISTNEMDAVKASGNFNAGASDTNALLAALSDWSPRVRDKAATELANRPEEATALLGTLHAMAADKSASPGSRHAACTVLGKIANTSSTSLLAQLLTDSESYVRLGAASAMRYMPNKRTYLNTILQATASTVKPCFPYDDDDPIQCAHAEMAQLLFYQGNVSGPRGILADSLDGVDRALLMPAVRAILRTPMGGARSSLTAVYPELAYDEFLDVSDDLFTALRSFAPADGMFSANGVEVGNDLFRKFQIAEGVPLARDIWRSYIEDGFNELKKYAGACLTVEPDPGILAHLDYYSEVRGFSGASSARTAIMNDTNPMALTPLKRIDSISADSQVFSLPKKSTTLHVRGTNYLLRAPDSSIYTWRKVIGPGEVIFGSNGTPQSKDTTAYFKDGIPGVYTLEVTMSDSIGYTIVRRSIQVTLRDASGNLPANTAPTAVSQSITITTPGVPVPITLTGSDPEGDPLTYKVLNPVVFPPRHGKLSGTAPYLSYTADFGYTGVESISFEVTDAQGLTSTGTVSIAVSPGVMGLTVYEPFDYPAGSLKGRSGASEVGLTGSWLVPDVDDYYRLSLGSYTYPQLPSKGNKLYGIGGSSGERRINTAALTAAGLLADGGELWFSAVIGISTTVVRTNTGLFFGLKDGVGSSGANAYICPDIDNSYMWPNDESLMVVVRCNWGATAAEPDTIQAYRMLNENGRTFLCERPFSRSTIVMDQTALNTIWVRYGADFYFDEFRVGPTLGSVVSGTVAATVDLTPPGPGPMAIASALPGNDGTSATLTAVPVSDERGVEYAFTCTSGNGHNSGWQDSNVYQLTGLTPGGTYAYTVRARDKSPAKNQTSPSAPAQFTLPAHVTMPALTGLSQAHATQILQTLGLTNWTVTRVHTGTVPDGIVLNHTPSTDLQTPIGSAVALTVEYNQTPFADSQSVATVEDTPLPVTLAGGDADGDPVTYSIVTPPAHGTLGGTVPNVTYTPAANYSGSDSFTFKVNAGALDSAVATVSITVAAVNDAPVANAGTNQRVTYAWTPAQIGCVAWYDADDASTITASAGAVSEWRDKSGNGRHATQGTAASRPTTGTRTINGLNTFDFDGASDFMDLPAFNLNGAAIYGVMEIDSLAITRIVFGHSTVNVQLRTNLNDGLLAYAAANPYWNDAGTISQRVPVSQGCMFGFVGGTSLGIVRDGRISQSGGNDGSGSTTFNTIGKRESTTTDLFDGKFGEIIICSDQTAGTREKIEGYLAHKWGLTGNLLADHPYKSAAPADGVAASVNLKGTVGDSDGDALTTTWSVVSSPENSTVTFGNAAMTNTPVYFSSTGTYVLRLTVTDAYTQTVSEVTITVVPNGAPPNTPPVANAQSVTTPEGTATPITLNGSDVNSDPLTYAIVAQPAHGTLSGTAPNVTYTPAANYNGSDSFTFSVSDPSGASGQAVVSITVTAVNSAPIVNAGMNQTVLLSGSAPWTPADIVCAAWYDAADTNTITASAGAVSQWADKSGNGNHATQGTAGNNPTTGTRTINGLNTLDFDGASDFMNTTSGINLAGKAVYGVIETDGLSAPQMLFGHNTVDVQLEIDMTSGLLGYAAAAPYWNDAATADQQITAAQGSIFGFVGDTSLGIVRDGRISQSGGNGGSGSTVFDVIGKRAGATPDPFNGKYGEIIICSDLSAGTREKIEGYLAHKWGLTANLPSGHPYKSVPPGGGGGTAVATLTGTASDPEADPLTTAWSVVSPTNAAVTFGNAAATNTTATFTRAGSYILRLTATDTFKQADSDVTITVTTNMAPVANAQSVTTPEDTAKAITLTGSDVYGNPLTYAIVTQPAHGVLGGTAPNVTYMPAANYNGSDAFTFMVTDSSGATGQAVVSITVTAVNDAPVADAQGATTAEDTAMAVTLTGSDADGDALTYSIVTQPANGTLTGTPPNVTYTPAANYNGSDSFTFKVNDPSGASGQAVVSIMVSVVNDVPVAHAQVVTAAEDTAKAITLAGSDPDGNLLLTYSIVTQPSHGTLSGTEANRTYTPDANYHGSDSFAFKVNDGMADSAVATVSITVTAVNDAPVVNAGTNQTVTLAYSPLWTPANMGLAAWYDAADTNTITASAGAVSQWADKSGNGNHATQGTAGSKPTTGTRTINGLNTLDFDGTSDFMNTTSGIGLVGKAIYGVMETDGLSATQMLFGHNTVNVQLKIDMTSGLLGYAANAPYWNDAATADQQITAAQGSIFGFVGDTSLGIVRDGRIYQSGGNNGSGYTGFNIIGKRTGATSDNFNGKYAEIIICSDVTAATRHKIEGYLAHKWGLVGKLPADHPYKNAAPLATTTAVANLAGMASDTDGDPLTTTWSVVSPTNADVTFGDAAMINTTASFRSAGRQVYVLRLTANDTYSQSVSQITITAVPTNTPPVASAQSVTMVENTAKAITLTGSDADGNPLTYTVVTQPAHGTLSGTAPNVTYTPASDYNGSDAFTFKVNDGTEDSPVATVSITVSAVNVSPVVNAGPDQSVTLISAPPPSAWAYAPWTGDADSDISSSYTYTAKHSFGNNRASATVNGVTFTEGNVTSGTGWSIGGAALFWDGDDDAAVTGNSELLAQEFVFNGTPRTVTFTGLTAGQSYQATFYSVGWETGTRSQTFSTPGVTSMDINQDQYGDNMGIRITCVYTATATSQVFTITPVSTGTFHLYAIANRVMPSITATVNLDGTVSDANNDPLTTTWSLVSGPAGITVGSTSAVDTTATFSQAGTYTLRLAANDGSGAVSDDVVVTVTTPGTYAVTYDGNGQTSGSVPVDGVNYANGATVTVLGNTGNLARAGYSFAGWNTAANGTGTAYAAGNTFAIGAAHVTLFAQWPPAPTVAWTSASQASANESGTLTVTAQLSATTASDVTVPFTVGGTASGTDYTFSASPIIIAAGETTGSATITLTADSLIEGNETVVLTMGTPTHAIQGTTTVHAATITDDDVNTPPTVNAGPDQVVSLVESTIPWTPSQIATAAWYDAADASKLQTSGSAVTGLLDKSGNGRNATQATAANQPVVTTWNGLPAIAVDSDDFLATSAADIIAGTDNYSVVAVMTSAFGQGADGLGDGWSICVQPAFSSVVLTSGGAAQYNAVSSYGGGLVTTVMDQSGEKLIKRAIDGAAFTSTSLPKTGLRSSARGFMLGRFSNSSIAGNIGEVIVIKSAIALSDQQKLEGYLAHKWGMAANLPAGHPYKSAAPTITSTSAVVNLDGTVSDANNDPLTTAWTLVSGPAIPMVGSTSAVDTTATFSQAGTYTLRLAVNDGFGEVTDDVVVTVNPVGAYSVIYDGNGNTGGSAPAISPYASGATATVSGNTGNLTNAGFAFNGWNTQANGSGTAQAAGSTFTMGAANVTLYAQWTSMSAFDIWIANGNLAPEMNATFVGDANGDGLANGLVWLLGGNTPTENPSALLPQAAQNGGNLSLSFKMLNSTKRGPAVLSLQYSRDLGVSDPWTNHTIQVPDATGPSGEVDFVITPIPGTDHNQVQVTIPASATGGGGKIFARILGVPQP